MPLENTALPTGYTLTDDEDLGPVSPDDEMFEDDPVEIHGKTLPLWCHKKKLARILKAQKSVDGDEIFRTLPKKCSLADIFLQSDTDSADGE
jgi:hypothetical protein